MSLGLGVLSASPFSASLVGVANTRFGTDIGLVLIFQVHRKGIPRLKDRA